MLSSLLPDEGPGEGVDGELAADALSLFFLVSVPVPSPTPPLARGKEPGVVLVGELAGAAAPEAEGAGSTPIVVSTLVCLKYGKTICSGIRYKNL